MNGSKRGTALWLIALVAVLAYGPTVFGTYVLDDVHSVRDNEALRSLANIPRYFTDPETFSVLDVRMYRPVLLTTFAVNYAISGDAVWSYRLFDLLLHVGCALAVFAVARRLRVGHRPAVFAGLLFAAHPLASEAVCTLSSRSDQLVLLAALVAMRVHVSAQRGARWAPAVTALLTAVACGSKATGVVVPGCLIALEIVAVARRRARGLPVDWSGAIVRLAPVIVVVIGYLALRREVLGVATMRAPRVGAPVDIHTGAGRDLVTQLATMALVLPQLLAQTVLPVGLSMDPLVPFTSHVSVPVLAGATLLLALTLLGLREPRRRPAMFVGTALAWGMTLPWAIVPLNQLLAEHRFYGPLAGLALVVGGSVSLASVRPRLGMAVVVVLFTVASFERSRLFAEPERLWQATLRGNPSSVRALCSLGALYYEDALAAGDRVDYEAKLHLAVDHVERAVAIQPTYYAAHVNVCKFHLALGPHAGEPFTAVATARTLVEKRPNNPFDRLLLSRCLTHAGIRSGSARFFDEAVRVALEVNEIAAPKGLVYRTAAYARRCQKHFDAAIALLDESIDRGLDHVSVRFDRAQILVEAKRPTEARAELAVILGREPFHAAAHQLLGKLRTASPR